MGAGVISRIRSAWRTDRAELLAGFLLAFLGLGCLAMLAVWVYQGAEDWRREPEIYERSEW